MEIKKFTTYEFDLKADGMEYDCVYKKDENNNNNSYIELKNEKSASFKIPLPVLASLFEAMKEVDPFGSVFDIAGEK